jgi:hypothetical protein
VHPDGATSNELIEVLSDWTKQLELLGYGKSSNDFPVPPCP